MSKRTESKKTAVFELEPDKFSLHTFELSMRLTKHEYYQMKDKLYRSQEREKNTVIYQERKGRHCCMKYGKHGVRICLEHNQGENGFDTYFVRMIVNPRMLIEPGCSYLGILPPEKSSVEKLEKAFKKLFAKTVFDNNINDYYLTRLDLCVNIRCRNNKLFRETVRVLRKLPTPPKYERKQKRYEQGKKLSKKDVNMYNKHYLCFVCGTHELVIYDKTYQLQKGHLVNDSEGLPEGVLRFEVHCEREYIRRIEKELDSDSPMKVLWAMVQKSEERIIDHFSRCFFDTKFVQMDALKRAIKESGYKKKNKDAMLELASRLQRTQSVDKALRKMEKQGYDTSGLLDRFSGLGISPIPLWKNFCAESLPGPVELLKRISGGDISVEYVKAKYK